MQLKTTQSYKWNIRETTEEGRPLSDLIDFGIQRSKYASEVTYNLHEELKKHAIEDRYAKYTVKLLDILLIHDVSS